MFRFTSSPILRHCTLAAVRTALSLSAICALPTVARSAGDLQLSVDPQPIAQSITDEIRYLERSGQRWIEIDLSEQLLTAWQGGRLVDSIYASTGKDSTPTPTGVFSIQTRYESTSMEGADYYVPDVPYAMFFYGGYAIHGAYWHNSFGYPVSHGCINLPVGDAEWLYYWASYGTPVVVHY